jgi:hypothetical protein
MKELEARVEAVMVANHQDTFVTNRISHIDVDFGGIPGDRHYGITRPSDARQTMYPRGTEILNRRQLTIVSVEELSLIARDMGVDQVLPEWLGANLLISGVSSITNLPMGSRILFPEGTGLICNGENLPCKYPGQIIQA